MRHLKEACSLYFDNIFPILLLAGTIGFPVHLVEFSFTMYGNFYFNALGLPGWAMLINIVMTVLAFNLIQLPYIGLAAQIIRGEPLAIRHVYRIFFVHVIPVIAISLLYLLGAVVGLTLLILPGIFMLALTLMFPYAIVIDGQRGSAVFKRTFEMGRSHVVDFILFIILFLSLNAVMGSLLTFGLGQFETNPLTLMVLRMVLNVLSVPLFTLVVTLCYGDWSPDGGAVPEADDDPSYSIS